MQKKFLSILISFAVFSLLTIFFCSPQIKALEYGGIGGKPAYPDENNPRSKSVFIYTLESNKSIIDGVLVVNNTQERKTLMVYATDSQKSSDGAFACEQFLDLKDDVGLWIKLEKSEVTLDPATNEIIPFTVTTPLSASVGEHNGCIMVQEKKVQDPNATGISLSVRTGSRVAVTIPGEQIRKLILKTFEANSRTDGIIANKVEVQNQGNVSIDANIRLSVDYPFGISHYKVDNQYPILRDEISTYNFEIPRPYWGGIVSVYGSVIYDANVNAVVGIDTNSKKEVLNSPVKYILVFPELPALLIEIVILCLIIFVIAYLIKNIAQSKSINKTWKSYVLQNKETITSIAEKFDVDWKLIAKVNKLIPPYELEEGMILKLPPMRE